MYYAPRQIIATCLQLVMAVGAADYLRLVVKEYPPSIIIIPCRHAQVSNMN